MQVLPSNQSCLSTQSTQLMNIFQIPETVVSLFPCHVLQIPPIIPIEPDDAPIVKCSFIWVHGIYTTGKMSMVPRNGWSNKRIQTGDTRLPRTHEIEMAGYNQPFGDFVWTYVRQNALQKPNISWLHPTPMNHYISSCWLSAEQMIGGLRTDVQEQQQYLRTIAPHRLTTVVDLFAFTCSKNLVRRL